MSSTDDRIVKMQFDNASFKKEALATKVSLDQVDAAVAKAGNGKGLLSLSNGMDTVKFKASAMQVAAVTALSTITTKIVNAGLAFGKSLIFDPIRDGFNEYGELLTKQNTIMNATGQSAEVVKKTLSELNSYSDKTIYAFSDMTEAITKFTNAGVDLDTATTSIKGIANSAAFAGASSQQAAGAMYGFSNAMSTGYMGLQDWQIIETAQMGTIGFKNELLKAGEAAGTLTKQGDGYITSTGRFVSATEGWRDGMQDMWVTTETLNGALGAYADESSSLGKKALESATKVRTFAAFMDTFKESIASGWAGIFTALIGGLDDATNMWTGLANAVGNVVGSIFGYLTQMITAFSEFGGRTAVLETLKNILSPIAAILGLIAKGWKAAFGGGDSGKSLATMAKALQHITRPLNVLGKLISGQISPMQAWQRVIEIVRNAIRNFADYIGGGVAKKISNLFNLDLSGGNAIAEFAQGGIKWIQKLMDKIGDLLAKVPSIGNVFGGAADSLLGTNHKIDGVSDGFDKLGDKILGTNHKIDGVSDGFDKIGDKILGTNHKIDGVSDGFEKLGDIFLGTNGRIDGVSDGFDKLGDKLLGTNHKIDGLSGSSTKMKSSLTDGAKGFSYNPDAILSTDRMSDSGGDSSATVGDTVGPAVSSAWDTLKKFLSNFNVEDLMAAFNLAVLSTFLITISGFFRTLTKTMEGFVGTGAGIAEVLEGTKKALGSFQTTARAKLITAIAIAIGILAVSLWILSRIPMDKMVTGLAGMAGIMLIMKVGVDSITKAVDKMSGKGTGGKMVGLSVALLALGGAILLLAIAFLLLEKVEWSAMLKGLLTIRVVMLSMERLGSLGENAAKNMLAAAFAISAIAFSMIVLAGALLLFQLVKPEAMIKAGLALGAMVASLYILGKLNTAIIAKAGGSMALMAVGMLLLANALLIFQMVRWESIAKAGVVLLGLTVALALLSIFMKNPVVVTGFVALSLAMIGLATAGLILNKVDWSSIGKIALIMGILVVGFAAFMAVVTIFAPVLIILSAFAGSIALLALALTGLFLAFALILPLIAIGTGAFAAFATGAAIAIGVFLTTLALQAPIMKKSILKIMQVAIDGIVEGVPMVIDGIKRLFVAIKDQFTGGGGSEAKGISSSVGKTSEGWMTKITDSIKKKMPGIVAKAVEIGGKFIDGLTKRAPEIAAKGAELVIGLINGIASRIGGIVDSAVNLIVKFAEGIGNNVGKILKAGVTLIADFLHGLADTIRSGSGEIGSGIKDVVKAFGEMGLNLVQGLADGIKNAAHLAWDAAVSLADSLPKWVKKVLGIASPSKVFRDIGDFLVQGLTKGIQDNAASAITAVASMVTGTITVASSYVDDFIQKLDQKAVAATAKAAGLQAAATKAANAAQKTKKNKKDDRSANKLQKAADKATTKADKEQVKVDEAKAAKDRADEYAKADLITKAQMKADDSVATLDKAKGSEFEAESKRRQADALREQAKAKGVSKKDAKEFKALADKLEAQAKRDAQKANTLLNTARTQATDAMELQRQAAAAAVLNYDQEFNDAGAKAKADKAYEAMTDAEKEAQRRKQASELQLKSYADLARAKELAFTDLNAANELAQQAMDEAQQSRDYLNDAEALAKQAAEAKDSQSVAVGGEVINLDPTQAAAIALGDYSAIYDAAYASAAGGQKVEFNQYNTSPEAISATDAYRYGNNQLAFAADKLNPAA